MKKIPLFVLAFILFCNAMQAQKVSTDDKPENDLLFKFSPVGLFSFEAGPEFFLEYIHVKNRLGIQLEVQPILFNTFRTGDNDDNAPDNTIKSTHPRGIELRPEIKYYLYPKPTRNRPWIYLSLDFIYKHTDIKRLGELPVFNGGTDPAFFKRTTYNDVKDVYGFNFKSGMIIPFSDSPFKMEISYGMGLRCRNFSFKNLPIGAPEPEHGFNFWDNQQQDGWLPSLPVSVRFIWKL